MTIKFILVQREYNIIVWLFKTFWGI